MQYREKPWYDVHEAVNLLLLQAEPCLRQAQLRQEPGLAEPEPLLGSSALQPESELQLELGLALELELELKMELELKLELEPEQSELVQHLQA